MDVEKTIEFILDQQARFEVLHQKSEEARRLTGEMHAKTEATLRRAIALSVREARTERHRRRRLAEEFDLKMTQLAAAQLVTEERFQALGDKLDKLTDALRHGKNGHT